MQQINTRKFAYSRGTFSAELSDFADMDTNDLLNGFELVSERTGKVVEMVIVGPRFDSEGDLTHWEFQPHSCFTFDDLIVFND